MFNPTRSQVLLVVSMVIGLVVGKLIKNYKAAFAIAIVLMLALSFTFKRRPK